MIIKWLTRYHEKASFVFYDNVTFINFLFLHFCKIPNVKKIILYESDILLYEIKHKFLIHSIPWKAFLKNRNLYLVRKRMLMLCFPFMSLRIRALCVMALPLTCWKSLGFFLHVLICAVGTVSGFPLRAGMSLVFLDTSTGNLSNFVFERCIFLLQFFF